MGKVQVRLQLVDGSLVHETEMPRFPQQPPDVLIWGTRFFKFTGVAFGGKLVYSECFTFAVT